MEQTALVAEITAMKHARFSGQNMHGHNADAAF